jgi:hypothetical protein
MTRAFDPTPLVRPWAGHRLHHLQTGNAVKKQAAILRHLRGKAGTTRFGHHHGLWDVETVRDYQKAVPVRTYEDFWEDWWKPAYPVLQDVTWPGKVPFFAVTSGTTSGTTKYIPLTWETLKQNRRAALDMVAAHLATYPESRLFGGRSFVLGGSTSLTQEAPGVRLGDLSGIVAKTAPVWMRPFTFPPVELALMEDWDEKLEVMVHAVEGRTITALSGVPSWVLIFFDRLEQAYDHWPLPDLELFVHGGIAWAPYAKRFAPYLARSGAVTREVYPASEGFVAFADRGPDDGLLLSWDSGLFFEFVPVEELDALEPTRHWLATIEPDIEYAILVTGPSGLWSYVLGDTVRFLETRPPRLVITGRTAYMLSAFGEHLIQTELDHAIVGAVEGAGGAVNEYVVGPVLPETGVGHHVVYVEPAERCELDADALARAIDAELAELNDDYRAHRKDDVGMAAPDVRLLPPGTCAEWLRRHGQLGGQHKVPRVVADPDRFTRIRQELEDLRAG